MVFAVPRKRAARHRGKVKAFPKVSDGFFCKRRGAGAVWVEG